MIYGYREFHPSHSSVTFTTVDEIPVSPPRENRIQFMYENIYFFSFCQVRLVS